MPALTPLSTLVSTISFFNMLFKKKKKESSFVFYSTFSPPTLITWFHVYRCTLLSLKYEFVTLSLIPTHTSSKAFLFPFTPGTPYALTTPCSCASSTVPWHSYLQSKFILSLHTHFRSVQNFSFAFFLLLFVSVYAHKIIHTGIPTFMLTHTSSSNHSSITSHSFLPYNSSVQCIAPFSHYFHLTYLQLPLPQSTHIQPCSIYLYLSHFIIHTPHILCTNLYHPQVSPFLSMCNQPTLRRHFPSIFLFSCIGGMPPQQPTTLFVASNDMQGKRVYGRIIFLSPNPRQ